MVQVALFEPEIAPNVGTILRLAACFGLPVHLIAPYGFVWHDKQLQRSGMDYIQSSNITHHPSAMDFRSSVSSGVASGCRVVALDVGASTDYTDFAFQPTDILLTGRESCGFTTYTAADPLWDESVRIPMLPDQRSLNVAVALAMVVGEALRQTRWR